MGARQLPRLPNVPSGLAGEGGEESAASGTGSRAAFDPAVIAQTQRNDQP